LSKDEVAELFRILSKVSRKVKTIVKRDLEQPDSPSDT
jgi:hypothetical protein